MSLKPILLITVPVGDVVQIIMRYTDPYERLRLDPQIVSMYHPREGCLSGDRFRSLHYGLCPDCLENDRYLCLSDCNTLACLECIAECICATEYGLQEPFIREQAKFETWVESVMGKEWLKQPISMK